VTLQNRVTPTGEIVALPGRGAMMGNRGLLHASDRTLRRTSALIRWIACRLEFRGRKRTVMAPGRYTELFFLDEATAFAAGHRPCAECRHADYARFRDIWSQLFGGRWKADEIDAVLHAERRDGRAKRTYVADVATLPDGTYVHAGGEALLVWGDALVAWSDTGYGAPRRRPPHLRANVLTPRSIVAVFRAGYRPAVHASLTHDGRR
jgi:hypothetical protein